MKIALIGASGTVGQRILKEALTRGHQVVAIVRDPSRVTQQDEKLRVVVGDLLDDESIRKAIAGYDVVISAYGPSHGAEDTMQTVNQGLIDAVKQAGVQRLLIVGGAGSLEVAPGLKLVNTPDFPEAWKAIALSAAETLEIYRKADLDWTYFSPAAMFQPGERTGVFRIGTDQLVVDEKGESRISTEDYAIAMLDEVEKPRFIRKRFTIAY
ncbi:NAD(P)-dependent oxidoreductase [Pelosinus sp. IPA-1]|uniref:NAD(P)-dependent oxidoreductase n=1 Tax=Pelosinus sp. IPA-1 TaxID=3029569 RepID=UPI0024361A64|nr:NAD(P)-dependent oxidoreductase [Pelosinus sp. IPA-1]GMA98490.1 3-beta hydroxysteroid dehydrogenase [Pelosinus sp. IPA-1]